MRRAHSFQSILALSCIAFVVNLAAPTEPSAQRRAIQKRTAQGAEHRASTDPRDAQADVDDYVRSLLRSLTAGPRQARPITLRDAIRTAVANNPGVLAGGQARELARQRVLEALSVYDPVFNSELNYASEDLLSGDALQEGGESRDGLTVVKRDNFAWDFRIAKLLEYGTSVDLEFTNERRTSIAQRIEINPAFEPNLGIAVRQPLFRDFAGLDARTTVLVARNSSRRAVADFETELSDFVAEVVRSYWGQVLAEAELEVRRTSLRLAEELVEDARARVKIGTLPPVAVKEAQADAAAREEEVIAARNDLDLAYRTLQYTVMLGIDETGPVPVRASEAHHPVSTDVDTASSVAVAIDERGEVRAARLELASAALDVKRAKRLVLPGLDFVIDWSLQGLAGDQNPGTDSQSEIGEYGDALDRLASTDNHRFFVGLELDVPFSNVEAKSRLNAAEVELRRQRDDLREVVSQIALEVEDAAGDVVSGFKRVAAARLARELAEENLRDQRKRYDVGMVTTTDILRFQDSLASAMAAEARAIADHAVATAELERAKGTLLDTYAIDVSFEDQPDEPWWVRF